MKMNTYIIARAGSTRIGEVYATCITKACKDFMETLDREAKYELYSREHASIRYTDNYHVMGDFVVSKSQW